MPLSPSRWNEISPSQFPWEREALDYVRERLPDQEPYRAWSNFEFVSDDGAINEVDLLVLAPGGLYLVEIKSWPGTLTGDAATWTRTHEGRAHVDDSPVYLANLKAKRLASLLKRQPAGRKVARFPYVEALVFLSHPEVDVRLQGTARYRVCRRDRVESGGGAPRGIVSALTGGDYDGARQTYAPPVDWKTAREVARAVEQAGVRPSQRSRRVGDYVLGTLLAESATGAYQDWEASHVALAGTKRRVRIYNVAQSASQEARDSIAKAARREFLLLESLSHPGILPAETLSQHELGPALVYRYDPGAVRLDHFLAQQRDRLSVDLRLGLIRQIAEALKYAHEKRVVHRALSPQSVLVSDPESDSPRVQIFNWQVGYRALGTTSAPASRLSPTLHPEQLVDDASTVFMAPEALSDPDALGEHVDVFSLGAIAYQIFSGRPPASSALELNERLREGKGLQISSVLDGAPEELQELVQLSTHPEVAYRIASVEEFLVYLDDAERRLRTPEEETVENPLEAKAGDRLEQGFTVVRALGSGSTAKAFLVERDGRETVLKLANSPEQNDRVREEAATLRKLRHQNIVEAYDDVEIRGLAGFTMQRAGETTLSQRLRAEGRLHLELLERFGEDLLGAVDYLEQVGIPHRDLKPDNIGIRPVGRGDKLHLVLFDFSLSRAPLESLRAGTPPYLDPFLPLRKPARWDLHAERFAAAMTLYEMATGTLPRWGDGQSNPEVLDCEATLNAELFDRNLRDAMSEFFARALRRDAAERFDNAEEMLKAWRHVFEAAGAPATRTSAGDEPFDREAALAGASLATHVVELGLSTRAANALDRLDVVTVEQLLAVPLGKLYKLRGVGIKTRKEITELVGALRERFPNARLDVLAEATTAGEEGDEPEVASVDLIARQIGAAAQQGKSQWRVLHAFLGADGEGGVSWPSQTEAASRLGITRARVGQVVTTARGRWVKSRSIAALRETIAGLLEANGGAMTAAELVAAVLAARGSGEGEPRRTQLASVVTRAAVEAERASEEPRFVDRRSGARVLVARDAAAADYAERLGREADRLAALDPIPTPARTLETLRAVAPPAGLAISDARLVRLAAAASDRAAVSSRLEIYPRGMAAARAIRLAHGALLGAGLLTVEEVRARVAGRYPEAEPLPDRPALDALLEEAELGLGWAPEADGGRGAYIYVVGGDSSGLTSASVHTRYATRMPSHPDEAEVRPEVADARIFENKLERAAREGGFLALTAPPGRLLRAERELVRRFGVERRSVDALLLGAMREQARTLGVDWGVVEQADASPRDGVDWKRLMILVDRSLPAVEEQLAQSERTLLLVYPGLLGRYDRMTFVDRLRTRVSTPGGGLHGVWVLLPSDDQSALPTLDGRPVPVIGPGQWARVPDAWIFNEHRTAGTGATGTKEATR